MLPAATVRALLNPARGRRHSQARARNARSPAGEIRSADTAARSHAHWLAAVFACTSKTIGLRHDPGRRRRRGASKAGTKNKLHRKHGTPVRGKGRVRSAASLGGPDPGATRRLCPSRIARALLGFVFEEVSKT